MDEITFELELYSEDPGVWFTNWSSDGSQFKPMWAMALPFNPCPCHRCRGRHRQQATVFEDAKRVVEKMGFIESSDATESAQHV